MARSHETCISSMLLALLHYGSILLCGYRGPASKGTILNPLVFNTHTCTHAFKRPNIKFRGLDLSRGAALRHSHALLGV